ncbi:MAG TPA: aldehyde dehydrogenase family protein, partial [Novosphingobium sp.]
MSGALQSFDPATGAVVWEGPVATPEMVAQAVETARAAFPAWSATPLAERVAIARTYKAQLEARSDALARLIARETGKPLWEGKGEVASMIGKVELSIAAQAERAGEKHSATAFGEAVLRHH